MQRPFFQSAILCEWPTLWGLGDLYHQLKARLDIILASLSDKWLMSKLTICPLAMKSCWSSWPSLFIREPIKVICLSFILSGTSRLVGVTSLSVLPRNPRLEGFVGQPPLMVEWHSYYSFNPTTVSALLRFQS